MVIPESSVKVRLNGREVARLFCRFEHPEEPSVGLLHNWSVFPSLEDIKSIRVHPREHTVSIHAQADEEALRILKRSRAKVLGGAPDEADLPVQEEIIPPDETTSGRVRAEEAYPIFSRMASRFHDTVEVIGIFGSYHVAGLADQRGRLLCQAGDVEMSVTEDRVLGKAFLSGLKLNRLTLLISDRLRSDTVMKAARHGISSVVTLSVVTSLALETAMKRDIDIINAKERGMITLYGRHVAEPGPEFGKKGEKGEDTDLETGE